MMVLMIGKSLYHYINKNKVFYIIIILTVSVGMSVLKHQNVQKHAEVIVLVLKLFAEENKINYFSCLLHYFRKLLSKEKVPSLYMQCREYRLMLSWSRLARMLDIFLRLKTLVKVSHIHIDSSVFRLHWCISSVILLTFSVIITTRQYVGNPIDCIHTKDVPGECLYAIWCIATIQAPS